MNLHPYQELMSVAEMFDFKITDYVDDAKVTTRPR